jgi:hypothetical protein
MLLKMPDFQKCTSTNGPGEMNGKWKEDDSLKDVFYI